MCWVVQLNVIRQVEYINNTTSQNNYSYDIHTYNLNIRQYVQNTVVKRMRSQALSKHEMQMYCMLVM